MKYFCIGDVHSFYTETIDALNKAGFDKNDDNHVLVLCGDAFDRGDESNEMLNFLQSLPDDRFVYVRGNHEDLLEDAILDVLRCSDLTGCFLDIGQHHFTNGTIKTLRQFTGMHLYDMILNKEEFSDKIRPILNWINTKTIDFFETKHYVFTHGWIPSKISYRQYKEVYDSDWRNASDNKWKSARWFNGMAKWSYGIRVPRKSVVCGHWHSSWGNMYLHNDINEEFPTNKLDEDKMTEAFKPFIDKGIIAIDGCVAYSGMVNVIILEEI